MVLEPPIELPGLKILAEVGRGATGVVYRAQDLRINRHVALKILLPGPDAERHVRAARFLREARILASLMHPNIPAINEASESQGQFYLIRQFVEGATLKDCVDARAIQRSRGIRVLADIEAALTNIHQQGFVHRNLQPENILVATDGTAKLIGFGRAIVVDDVGGRGTAPATVEGDLEALRSMRDWLHSAIA